MSTQKDLLLMDVMCNLLDMHTRLCMLYEFIEESKDQTILSALYTIRNTCSAANVKLCSYREE